MAKVYSRIHRLLKIITLVQSQPSWTAKRLAEECGTVERTIYRDMREIIGAGVPIYFDKEARQYFVRKDFYLPSVDLTFAESMALITLGLYLREEEQIPFTKAALTALAKIRSHLPPKIAAQVADVDRHMTVKLAAFATQEGMTDVFERVQRALATRRCLRCRYEAVKDNGKAEEWFLFKPYALYFNQRAWYVVGFHGSRDGIRTLKINRFAAIEETDTGYTIPANFSMEVHLGNAWRMIRGSKTYDVELVFDAEFAETIADTVWHKSQEFCHLDDGLTHFTFKVDGLDEIVWWILSMGPHCRVVNPPELVDLVRKHATETAALYGKPTAKNPRKSPIKR